MDLEQLVSAYKPSESTVTMVQSAKLLLIAGVVGGGKNTVVNQLAKDPAYHLLVSHTTRSPRANHGILEQDGIDYHFTSVDKTKSMLANKEFVEAKYVHGNVYGTSTAEVAAAQQTGRIALTDVDTQGVQEYLAIKPDTHAIFLLPPSVETWLKRLERRYGNLGEHKDELDKRFKTARDEIAHIQTDSRFIIVINDDLDTTVKRIEEVLSGEISKSSEYADAVTEQ